MPAATWMCLTLMANGSSARQPHLIVTERALIATDFGKEHLTGEAHISEVISRN